MLLGEEAGATLSAKARKAGVTTRYHIELTITRGGNQGLISKVRPIGHNILAATSLYHVSNSILLFSRSILMATARVCIF